MTKSNPQEYLFFIAILSCAVVGLLPGLLKLHIKPEAPLKLEEKVFISTKDSFYHTRLKPRFSILAAAIAITFASFILFLYHDKLLAFITFAVCSFVTALPAMDMRIKEVAVVDDGLLISDFTRSEKVPFSEIKSMTTGSARATAAYVFVEFSSKVSFGKKIYFLPVERAAIKQLLRPHAITLKGPYW